MSDRNVVGSMSDQNVVRSMVERDRGSAEASVGHLRRDSLQVEFRIENGKSQWHGDVRPFKIVICSFKVQNLLNPAAKYNFNNLPISKKMIATSQIHWLCQQTHAREVVGSTILQCILQCIEFKVSNIVKTRKKGSQMGGIQHRKNLKIWRNQFFFFKNKLLLRRSRQVCSSSSDSCDGRSCQSGVWTDSCRTAFPTATTGFSSFWFLSIEKNSFFPFYISMFTCYLLNTSVLQNMINNIFFYYFSEHFILTLKVQLMYLNNNNTCWSSNLVLLSL